MILIKDTSVTAHSPEELANFVNELSGMQGWDIFYFTRWGDRCDLYQDKKVVGNNTVSQSPGSNGFQAIMLTPKCRDILLQRTPLPNGKTFHMDGSLSNTLYKLANSGQLRSFVVRENVFNFDKTLATSPADIAKLTQCANPESFQQTASGATWAWFLLIAIIVIVLALILLRR